MYCSSCGTQIVDGIYYCSRCGSPTEKNAVVVRNPSPGLFVVGASFVAIVGLGIIIPLLRILLDSRLDPASIGFILLAYFATLVLMFSAMMVFAWKFWGSTSIANKKAQQPNEYRPPATFRDPNTSQLYPGDPNFGSVTDSTTRTLDEVLVERKS